MQGLRTAGIQVGVTRLKIEQWMWLVGLGGFVGPMGSVSSAIVVIDREKGQ